MCVCVWGGGSVCECSVWFCIAVLKIEAMNGAEVLVWLRCISQMLTIDHSFQSFLDNTVLLLAITNTELLLSMPLLTVCCCWRWHGWSYAADPGDAIPDAMLLLAMPLLALCYFCDAIAGGMLLLAMPFLALCCYWRTLFELYIGSQFSSAWLCEQNSWNRNRPSSVCPCRKYYLCTQYAAFLPISAVAPPGSYARTFFLIFKK